MSRWSASVNLGKIRTLPGRVIVFSNQFQHCVTRLFNPSDTEIASRKILCFFIVDPDNPIVSTLDVSPQQWEHTRQKLLVLLLLITRARFNIVLPRESAQQIVSYCKVGFTRAEAENHRLELMRERKPIIDEAIEYWEREYSLCEH